MIPRDTDPWTARDHDKDASSHWVVVVLIIIAVLMVISWTSAPDTPAPDRPDRCTAVSVC
jgi:hypothetical protein